MPKIPGTDPGCFLAAGREGRFSAAYHAAVVLIEKLISISKLVVPKSRLSVVEDQDDNKVIECALEGKVEYIITNDNHLLKLNSFNGIKIITPEMFLEIFNN